MPYLKRINSLPLINHISYKYAQVSDIGPSWSSCSVILSLILSYANAFNLDQSENMLFCKELNQSFSNDHQSLNKFTKLEIQTCNFSFQVLGQYCPAAIKTVSSEFSEFESNTTSNWLNWEFESNTTSDWLNHLIYPIGGCVTFKFRKSCRENVFNTGE